MFVVANICFMQVSAGGGPHHHKSRAFELQPASRSFFTCLRAGDVAIYACDCLISAFFFLLTATCMLFQNSGWLFSVVSALIGFPLCRDWPFVKAFLISDRNVLSSPQTSLRHDMNLPGRGSSAAAPSQNTFTGGCLQGKLFIHSVAFPNVFSISVAAELLKEPATSVLFLRMTHNI